MRNINDIAAGEAAVLDCEISPIFDFQHASAASGMRPPKSSPSRQDPLAVPAAVVNRLSMYLRELQHLIGDGNEIAELLQCGHG